MRTLITGGAGFIGSHLTRFLLARGWQVTILDSFLPQVHGTHAALEADIASEVTLIKGDVADPEYLGRALEQTDYVVHLAAETGTGQSMYEVCRYERTNLGGTATLYDLLAKGLVHRPKRIVVASSRAIYGEGAYLCDKDGIIYPQPLSNEAKRHGQFDPVCPLCGSICESVPTPESAPLQPTSFYGLTKQVQEQTAILFGQVLAIPTVALRFQNVYGPGQSLENPYTGILAIFSNLARQGLPLQVFEDGEESRDFLYIDDAVRATAASLQSNSSACHVINVGSNQKTSVFEVAKEVNAFYGNRAGIKVTGAFRDGDIRHGMADLTRAKQLLGYEPQCRFSDGIRNFLEWANRREPGDGGYDRSLKEMKQRGLLHERS